MTTCTSSSSFAPVLTAAAMRSAEEKAFAEGVDAFALMQRAGMAAARAIQAFAAPADVLVLAGPGNNGGDGYVVAQILREAGWPVRVAALAPPTTAQAQQARAAWQGDVEEFGNAAPATVVIDALFGIGMTRALDTVLADKLAAYLQQARTPIAIDVPSGVQSDTGALWGARIAYDMTVSFHSHKPAHLLQPATHLCGRVVIADIGLPSSPSDIAVNQLQPRRAPTWQDHKYSRGHVLVVGGAMPGAARLSAGAAQRAGAGYVSLACRDHHVPLYAANAGALVVRGYDHLKALVKMASASNVHAVALGPGLGTDDVARALAEALVQLDKAAVLDADIFTLFAQDPDALCAHLGARHILTPHSGEFARFFAISLEDPIDAVRHAAQRAGAVVVLKGNSSLIAQPDGRVVINPPAPATLASAGTGDILTGIAAALLASGLPAFDAACQAVALHSAAARRIGAGLVADDMWAALAHV